MSRADSFIDKVKNTQKKAERNKHSNGQGSPGEQLSNKQHGTNK
ncbi:DUF4023 family protein [Paenibacillus paeoniae]|uniref:DUF4023 domain-containing protein n=1 Tax=Paenibacillus paeoniae TaxID=2292705 RepID=A0A371P745_9BACL|nr:DUF4023 family protein [Paenibacillus paeoniae]REK71752.1 DUF4023 domain-containing protein [Paenibacillus paeoniae]